MSSQQVILFVQLEMTAVTTTTALLSSKRVAVTRGRKGGNSTADSVAKLTTGTVAVAASGTTSVACEMTSLSAI